MEKRPASRHAKKRTSLFGSRRPADGRSTRAAHAAHAKGRAPRSTAVPAISAAPAAPATHAAPAAPAAQASRTAVKPLGSWISILLHFAAYLVMLLFWETLLYHLIKGSFAGWSPFLYFFAPAEAMVMTFLAGWLRKAFPAILWDGIVAVLVSAFYIAQTIYFSIFGSVFSLSMIGMGADAMGNFGWAVGDTLRQIVGVLALILLPVAGWIVLRSLIRRIRSLRYHPALHALSAGLAVVLWIVAVLALPIGGKGPTSAYDAYHGALVDSDTASSRLGVLTNSTVELGRMVSNLLGLAGGEEIGGEEEPPAEPRPEDLLNILPGLDFEALAEQTKDDDIRSICEYCARRSPTAKNDFTGKFKDYNLIYICAESFSSYALDPVVTPTLYKLANEGIVLDNYYNSFRNTTTNGEFSFLTSLWPDVSRYAKMGTNKGSFPQSASNAMPLGLGTLFQNARGTVSRGYHNYLGSYYCRNQTLPNLGFTCKFMNAGMNFTSSWPASDLEMMQQSVDDYIGEEPFCAYYMTFSGHGPYTSSNVIYNRNIATVRNLLGDRKLTENAIGYLATNYELEKAMDYLMQRLEKAGQLDKTVIVLTGDHYPYYLDDQGRNSIAGHTVETNFELFKSTCTIWCGGMEEPLHVSEYCCNVDIYPTILNLFGISYDSRLLAGTDIFSDSPHVAMLYNKSFLTDGVRYNAANGRANFEDSVTMTSSEKSEFITSTLDSVTAKYLFSLKVVDKDFYGFVWNHCDPEKAPEEEPAANPEDSEPEEVSKTAKEGKKKKS